MVLMGPETAGEEEEEEERVEEQHPSEVRASRGVLVYIMWR